MVRNTKKQIGVKKMEPVTMGLIAGGIGATAGLAGNFVQAASSKKLMQKQYHYNKKMMQNAYQWTVEDLKKAGLNPNLAYTNGATSGSGVGLPSAPDYASSAQQAISQGFEQYIALENLAINSAKTNAEIQNQTNLTNAQIEAMKFGNAKTQQETKQTENQNKIIEKGIETSEKAGNILENTTENITDTVNSAKRSLYKKINTIKNAKRWKQSQNKNPEIAGALY